MSAGSIYFPQLLADRNHPSSSSSFHHPPSASLDYFGYVLLNVYFLSPRFLGAPCPKGAATRTEEKRGSLKLFLFAPPHREADEKFSWTMCSHLYPPLHHLYCASCDFPERAYRTHSTLLVCFSFFFFLYRSVII